MSERGLSLAEMCKRSRYVDGICAIVDWATTIPCGFCGADTELPARYCCRNCRQSARRIRNRTTHRDEQRRYRARRKATA